MPGIVRLHRVFAAKPEKVYRAFLDAAAMAKWISPNGYTCTVHHMDVKVGGTYRMSFMNFTTQQTHTFGGHYMELVPNERIRYSDIFEDPNMSGEINVTIDLKEVSVGTEITILQEGIPDIIPVESCYLGWENSLTNLKNLVEPDITDDGMFE